MINNQRIVKTFCLLMSLTPLVSFSSAIQIGLDNDVIFKADGDYTGGIFAGYGSSPADKNILGDAFSLSDSANIWSLQLQQRLWTPTDIGKEEPQPNERPYAGVLTLNLATMSFNESESLRMELVGGVIGPSSGAETLQKTTHRWFSSTYPEGWSYQVKNHAIIDVEMEYDQLFVRSGNHEFSGFGRAVVGNFQPEIVTGLGWRWGKNLDSMFNAQALRPYKQRPLATKSSVPGSYWYLYGSLEARYRFEDLTVTGETLKPVHSVSLQKAQALGAIGIVGRYRQVGAIFSVMGNTKDFKEDSKKYHFYSSLQLFWQF